MIIDVNVNLSRWPFRRTPCDDPRSLVATLLRNGVGQAWTGTLDGLFHRDVGGANARLAEECQRCGLGLLVPFGSVNPLLPDWHEDVRRCRQDFKMPGIRLHPNYHGYRLDDAVFAEVLQAAQRQGLIVQLVLRMDDVRVQHRLMQVADVDLAPLAKALAVVPRLPVVVLNVSRANSADLKKLAALRMFPSIAPCGREWAAWRSWSRPSPWSACCSAPTCRCFPCSRHCLSSASPS
jgi:predicted TIM-barrel fold metal-dependent hydrolase